MEFKVGDRVTWAGYRWYGEGTVVQPNDLEEGQVAVRFDNFEDYIDESGELPDHHALYAKDLSLVEGGTADLQRLKDSISKRTRDSFALSRDWDERTDFRKKVNEVLQEVEELLVEKNDSYGDAALNPARIFSKADSVEQLKVRIDDKLSRVQRGNDYGEDTVTDLIGYLTLLKIAEGEAPSPR